VIDDLGKSVMGVAFVMDLAVDVFRDDVCQESFDFSLIQFDFVN